MCEDCWSSLGPHNGREPATSPAKPEPHPLVKLLARFVAWLAVVALLAVCFGVAVRAVQWAWPG